MHTRHRWFVIEQTRHGADVAQSPVWDSRPGNRSMIMEAL